MNAYDYTTKKRLSDLSKDELMSKMIGGEGLQDRETREIHEDTLKRQGETYYNESIVPYHGFASLHYPDEIISRRKRVPFANPNRYDGSTSYFLTGGNTIIVFDCPATSGSNNVSIMFSVAITPYMQQIIEGVWALCIMNEFCNDPAKPLCSSYTNPYTFTLGKSSCVKNIISVDSTFIYPPSAGNASFLAAMTKVTSIQMFIQNYIRFRLLRLPSVLIM